jgi:hypothetical protein
MALASFKALVDFSEPAGILTGAATLFRLRSQRSAYKEFLNHG